MSQHKSIYLVKRERRSMTCHDAPPNWGGLWLDVDADPGDTIVARIELEIYQVDQTGPMRARVARDRGLPNNSGLLGQLGQPQNSARCIALVLGRGDGCLQVNVIDTPRIVTEYAGRPWYQADPNDLYNVIVQRSRIGCGWRPLAEIEEEIMAARPALDRIAAEMAKTIAQVIEARWAAYVLNGGGTQMALVQFEGDAEAYVVEWGVSEDGPYDIVLPLAWHNRLVEDANDAL